MLNESSNTPPPPVRTRTRPAAKPVVNDPVSGASSTTSLLSEEPPTSPPSAGAATAIPAPKGGDYEVGYAKPPRQSQFKPGQSGNPKGRVQRSESLNTIVRKRMLEPVQLKTAAGIERVSRAEALFMKAIDLGGKGQMRAIEKILALYCAAVPEPQQASGSSAPPDPVDLSAADQAILGILRAEVAAELRSKANETDTGAADGEEGDA